MKQETSKPNRNKLNLLVDFAIFLAFLVAMAPHFSGVAIHEWLSIAFGAALITHLLLHWQWIVDVTKRFFRKTQWTARLNYVLNALLFIDMTIAIFSGLMISQSALPLFNISTTHGGIWRTLHSASADSVVLLIGLHIALHWSWIVNMVKRFIITPLLPRRFRPQLAKQAASGEIAPAAPIKK